MGGKSTTSTQSVSIPPEVLARYNAVNARAESVAQQPFQQYQGQFVAPLTPTQQAGVQGTSQAANLAQPYYGAATGLALAGAQPVSPGPLQVGQYMSPYTGYVAGATEAALRQQQGQQLSQQQAEAIKGGAFGGDRAGIQRAVLQGQQGLATAQALAPIYQQGYGQALTTAQQQQQTQLAAEQANRQALAQAGQQVAGLGAGAQQAALQGAAAQLQAGTQEQQTQQADLTARYQQFLQERGYPFQVAQFLANIAMGTGALSGSTTTTQQPAGLFSDKRLKHDAKRIGKTDDGLPIYTFKYNGDDKTHMGVMAQDAEKKHKDAVGLAPAADGQMYKTVDYDKLHERSERAYGGGLDASSMGGAVYDPGEYARGGYALGGGLIGDTEMKSMMANMKQPPGMYQQAGLYGSTPYQTPYGPGLGIRGDAVPVPSLVTAGKLSTPESPVKQALGAYKTVTGLGEMGSGIYDVGERVAVGRPERKDDKGNIIQKASSGLFGSEGTTDKPGWFGKAATGGLIVGRHHYDDGGDVDFSSDNDPNEDRARVPSSGFPSDVLKSGAQHAGLATAKGGLGGQSSGLGDIASGIGVVKGLGDLFGSKGMFPGVGTFLGSFFADGGLVPRQGYANEGAVDESDPLHPTSLKNYTYERAKAYGLDPDFAVKVFGGESGFKAHAEGDDKSSFNVPQLHYSGISDKYPNAGLGNQFTKATGLHASDPKAARDTIDWSLKYVAEDPSRWSNWTVARNLMAAQGQDKGLGVGKPEATKSGLSGLADAFIPTKKSASGEEVTDWKKLLIPLATGIAGAASAPTRNWGTALAMGLGAGAQSYQNIDTKQIEQELKAREVATGEKRASIEDATRRMQLLTQLRQLAAGLARSGQPVPPYLEQQINELTRSLTTSAGSPELAGAAKAGLPTLAGPPKVAAGTTAAQPPVQEGAPKKDSAAEQSSQAIENVKKGPAPTEPQRPELSSDFLSKLDPNSNPKILRDRAKAADVLSPGSGDQLMKDAQALEDKIYEKGHGVGPGGEIIEVPGLGEYKAAVANMPKLKEFLDAQRESTMAFVDAEQRLKNVKKIFETFQPGKFAEQKAEFQAAVRALGFELDDTATINAAKVQELAKESTRMTFDQVKALGGQPRVIEFQMNKVANPDPSLQPRAAERIVAEQDSFIAWRNKYYNDLNKAYEEQGWKFDPNKFTYEWLKKPENSREKFHDEADRNVAVRGAVPREDSGKVDLKKLRDGQSYIVEPGMGIPQVDSLGEPIKLRWDNKKGKFVRP